MTLKNWSLGSRTSSTDMSYCKKKKAEQIKEANIQLCVLTLRNSEEMALFEASTKKGISERDFSPKEKQGQSTCSSVFFSVQHESHLSFAGPSQRKRTPQVAVLIFFSLSRSPLGPVKIYHLPSPSQATSSSSYSYRDP